MALFFCCYFGGLSITNGCIGISSINSANMAASPQTTRLGICSKHLVSMFEYQCHTVALVTYILMWFAWPGVKFPRNAAELIEVIKGYVLYMCQHDMQYLMPAGKKNYKKMVVWKQKIYGGGQSIKLEDKNKHASGTLTKKTNKQTKARTECGSWQLR